MSAVIASPFVQIVAIPVVLLLVGVLARRLGRRDGDKTTRKNDWAVGTTLLLMALGTILGDLQNSSAPVPDLPWWLIGVLAAAFVSLEHDRFRSWERDANGLPTEAKRLYIGIIFPDIFCFAVFASYQAHKVNLI